MWDIEMVGGPSDGFLFGLPERSEGHPPTELRTLVQPGQPLLDDRGAVDPVTVTVPIAVYILHSQQGNKWFYRYKGQISADS